MNATLDLERSYQEALQVFGRGEFADAERCCQALLQGARPAGVLHLLGLCQLEQARPDEAIRSFQEAIQQVPNNPLFFQNLGRAYSLRGEWFAAAQAYTRSIDLDPRVPENYLYLGPIYEQVGDMESAERAYRRSLELKPSLATAAASLAALYERTNRLDEAEALATTALQHDPTDQVANLTRAQLDYRKGAYAESAERLERLLQQPLSTWNRSLAGGRLGTAYDQLGRHDDAYGAFSDGKKVLLDSGVKPLDTGVYSFASLARVRGHLDALFDAGTEPPASGAAPVFLVGFPRSGTTLLDQILSSHPGIAVLEEKNILQKSLQEFTVDEVSLERLLHLDAATRESHRQRYWQLAAKALGAPLGDRILVDKLPLYTGLIPVIRRIFPDARFIFAVRDPRDVVLSCLMHPFSLNEAMRHFLTLDDTAAYYAAVMDIGIASLKRMPEQALQLHYEALVEDTEAETRRLCGFMGVEWRDELLRFYDTAKRRQVLSVSYHQVVQPVYQTARGRWRHYVRHLEPVLGRLQPYVEHFGYPA